MSILATDKKLITFGTDYSAGSGISIIDHTISIVPSAVGKTYSAGPNIDIYDVSGQPTISSKDWSNEIADASANSYTQSTSYFNNWVNGQYTGDITNITNNLTALSGDLSSYYKKTETSSKEQINDALQYVSAHAVGDVEVNNYVHNNSATIDEVNSAYKANSASYITAHQSLDGYATESWVNAQGYLTGVNIPESATWNETSNVVSSNSASWSQGKTYEGVSPIVVNNAEDKISADTWTLSAGEGVSFTDDSANKVTRIDVDLPQQDLSYISAQIDNKLNKSEIGFRKVNSIDYVSGISGKNISAKFAYRANTAYNADHATSASYDDNGNSLTTTYYNAQEANNKVNDLFNFVQSNSSNWEGGSSPSVDNKVLFYKNYSYDPSNGSQNIDTSVSGATELYFEAAVDSQQSTPSEIVLYRNGNEIGRAYWSQVSSDGTYNYLTAFYNNADGGEIQIQNYNSTNYSNFDVSANGVKALFLYLDSYDCATDKEVKFNINGFNIVGQINGMLQGGSYTTLTSFTGSLTDFTAKGYNKYDTNITYEDSNNSYNYYLSAEFGGTLTGEFVPQSAFDELKQSYDALSSLFATYSGQWLLPNEGV